MSKKIRNMVIALLLLLSLASSFWVGCALGSETRTGQGMETGANQGDELAVIEEAWNHLFRDYVDKDKLDADMLIQAAIEGMVSALDDPYTSYVGAKAYQLNLPGLEGEFGGIGARINGDDGQITIVAVLPNTPAAGAGLNAGDVILEVDGKTTSGMSVAEAVLNIRGKKGTTVKLLIQHQGAAGFEEIEIVRARIELPSVSFEMREEIAYIQMTHFSARTPEELGPALEIIIERGATAIILDLRSNPGGSLAAVVEAASFFLKNGVVLKVVDNRQREDVFDIKQTQLVTDLPMVVLVDKFSASGSEVLSGALQDHERATIIGVQTFGKGSVNTIRKLSNGAGLYITIARWLTPGGQLIEGEGITPDIEIKLEGEDAIQWAIDYLKQ